MAATATKEAVEEPESPTPTTEVSQCICPLALETIARARGLSCQEVFEVAFARVAVPTTFARAVFVSFMLTPDNEDLIPWLVQEFAASERTYENTRDPELRGYCIACKMNWRNHINLTDFFSRVHPDVVIDRAFLEDLAIPLAERLARRKAKR